VDQLSAEESVVAAGAVGEDCRIQHLTAAGAFPGIKGSDKVIELFGEHTALAAWTLHNNPPIDVIAPAAINAEGCYTNHANINKILH
jgi:hypothetical protein